MSNQAYVFLFLALFAASVVALLFVIGRFGATKQDASTRITDDLLCRFSGNIAEGTALWSGAWLVTFPRRRRAQILQETMKSAENGASPTQILDLWQAEQGKLFSHVMGPSFTSEGDASIWLRQTSEDLAANAVAGAVSDGQCLFALVYASHEAPAPDPRSLKEISLSAVGAGSVGAAFVACAEDDAARIALGSRSRNLVLAVYFLGAFSLGMLIVIGVLVVAVDANPKASGCSDAAVVGSGRSNLREAPSPKPTQTGTTTHTTATPLSSESAREEPGAPPDRPSSDPAVKTEDTLDAGNSDAGGTTDAGESPKIGAPTPAVSSAKRNNTPSPSKSKKNSPAGPAEPFATANTQGNSTESTTESK